MIRAAPSTYAARNSAIVWSAVQEKVVCVKSSNILISFSELLYRVSKEHQECDAHASKHKFSHQIPKSPKKNRLPVVAYEISPATIPIIAQRPFAFSALSQCVSRASCGSTYIRGSVAHMFCCPNSFVVTVIVLCKELLHNYIAIVKFCQHLFVFKSWRKPTCIWIISEYIVPIIHFIGLINPKIPQTLMT